MFHTSEVPIFNKVKPFLFKTHQGMRFRWVVDADPEFPVFIFFDNTEGGFRQEFLSVERDMKISFEHAWNSTPDALLADTGVDLTKSVYSFGVIAEEREKSHNQHWVYKKIVHRDEHWVKGEMNRIQTIAKSMCEKSNVPLYYSVFFYQKFSHSCVYPSNSI